MPKIFTNRDQIIEEFLKRSDEGREDYDDIRKLLGVYHHALMNPPEGVIGVGAITYAEQKLREAQQ